MELSCKEKVFKCISVKTTNNIANLSTLPHYLDTIVYIGMDSLRIQNTLVIIRPFNRITVPDEILSKGMEFKALITGEQGVYILNIQKCGRQEAIRLISHELIHLKQFVNGELIFYKDYTMWKGKKVDQRMYYEDRPWEQEAFGEQQHLIRKINAALY
jgi:hypothetical protein